MNNDVWMTILILIVAGIAGYSLYRSYQSGKTIDVSNVVGTLETSVPLAKEIIDVAQTAVNSIEQLRRQPGSTITNSEAFARATNTVRKWFPSTEEVTDEQIITAVNSAILVASTFTHQIRADKAVVAEAIGKGVPVDAKQTP